MEKSKFLTAEMAALALIFGLVLAGCDNGTIPSDGNSDPKTLIIQDIPENVYAYGQYGGEIGIFTDGTTPEQAMLLTGIVAGADLSNRDIIPSGSGPYTLTIPLYNINDDNRWTGSGTFAVYMELYDGGAGHYYSANSVNITSGTTTVLFSSTTEVSQFIQEIGVTIDEGDQTIVVGDTFPLNATVTPLDSTVTVTWSSSKIPVAAVEPQSGVVTGAAGGRAVITATAGKASDTITVTVKDPNLILKWTEVSDSPERINAIAYGGSRFVAGGGDGKIAYSTDNGESWTEVSDSPFSSNRGIHAIAYGGGRFVAGGDGGIVYSDTE
jgi:hypothetical protein